MYKRVADHGQPPLRALCRSRSHPENEWHYFVCDQDPNLNAYTPGVEWFVPDFPADDDIEPPPAPTIPPDPLAEKLRDIAGLLRNVDHFALGAVADELDARWWQPMDTLPDSGRVLVAWEGEKTHTKWVSDLGANRARRLAGIVLWAPLPPHPHRKDQP